MVSQTVRALTLIKHNNKHKSEEHNNERGNNVRIELLSHSTLLNQLPHLGVKLSLLYLSATLTDLERLLKVVGVHFGILKANSDI